MHQVCATVDTFIEKLAVGRAAEVENTWQQVEPMWETWQNGASKRDSAARFLTTLSDQ